MQTRKNQKSKDDGFASEHSDSKLSLQGTRWAVRNVSKLAIFSICVLFGFLSTAHTLLGQQILQKNATVSPVMLLMVQCAANVLVGLSLMIVKEARISSFSPFKKYGIVIPELSFVHDKMTNGIKIGIINLFTAIIGLFALKQTSLPVFLAVRRSEVSMAILFSFILLGQKTSRSNVVSAMMLTCGALMCTFSVEDESIALLCYGCNFAHTMQNIITAKVNENQALSLFEINFFFSFVGLITLMAYNAWLTDNLAVFKLELMNGASGQELKTLVYASCAVSCLLSFSMMSVLVVGGPIMIFLASVAKDVILSTAAFYIFGDAPMDSMTLLAGLLVSLAGIAFTTKVKLKLVAQEKQSAKTAKKIQ